MPEQIYLVLHPGTSVGVDYQEALKLDRNGFADLFQKHVYGAKRKAALAWADEQIQDREDALNGA